MDIEDDGHLVLLTESGDSRADLVAGDKVLAGHNRQLLGSGDFYATVVKALKQEQVLEIKDKGAKENR